MKSNISACLAFLLVAVASAAGCGGSDLPANVTACDPDADNCGEDCLCVDTGAAYYGWVCACPKDCPASCGDNSYCVAGECICVPDCGGRTCGDDGCGGTCGACTDSGTYCNADGQCQAACTDMICGEDHGVACGTCPDREACDDSHQCVDACGERDCGEVQGVICGTCLGATEYCSEQGVCVDACDGKMCGESNGIVCGTCDGLEFCDAAGLCQDACGDRECGESNGVACGTCVGETIYCNVDGKCVDACEGLECGERQEFVCGTCEGTEVCTEANLCEDVCANRECGIVLDKDCGSCASSTEVCNDSGQCVDVCANIECGLYGDLACGQCDGATMFCNELGNCQDACEGRDCGMNHGIDCGTCSGASEFCDAAGACQDACMTRECGPNLGYDCGTCVGTTEYCTAEGACVDACDGRICGVFESKDCGACSGASEFCTAEGQCEDACANRECGSNLGYDCGKCAGDTEVCGTDGICVDACDGRVCGENLGVVCGSCDAGQMCESGACVDAVGNWVSMTSGMFTMGSELGAANQKPTHKVDVDPFAILDAEITVRQYRACVDAGVCTEPGRTDCSYGVSGREGFPMDCVTWAEADAFCQWVGGRLPSEAEWEYAASSLGSDNEWPWGMATPSCQRAVMFDPIGGCPGTSSAEVCSKPSGNTPSNLCDMAGNVAEWVADYWHDTYDGAPMDSAAWLDPVTDGRVVRGGSFADGASAITVTGRVRVDQSTSNNTIGFRCARYL